MSRADFVAYERFVLDCLAVGVSREAAEREAHTRFPDVAARRDRISEKDEQHEVRKLFIAHGFTVYNLSQARASKQTPGLPDLWAMHRARPIGFWWETKRQVGGKLSEAQTHFADACERCGILHGVGDRHAAEVFLAHVLSLNTQRV